jgi:hypothetical protein
MALGTRAPKTFAVSRREIRIPMEVGVQITGDSTPREPEATFTENVSSRGARVWSARRWKTDERLVIVTVPGSFRSTARVAYCRLARGTAGYAVGLEFLETTGNWVTGECAAGEPASFAS